MPGPSVTVALVGRFNVTSNVLPGCSPGTVGVLYGSTSAPGEVQSTDTRPGGSHDRERKKARPARPEVLRREPAKLPVGRAGEICGAVCGFQPRWHQNPG